MGRTSRTITHSGVKAFRPVGAKVGKDVVIDLFHGRQDTVRVGDRRVTRRRNENLLGKRQEFVRSDMKNTGEDTYGLRGCVVVGFVLCNMLEKLRAGFIDSIALVRVTGTDKHSIRVPLEDCLAVGIDNNQVRFATISVGMKNLRVTKRQRAVRTV